MFTHNALISVTMATPELSLNTSPWQHQSCHSIHHHGNTRAVTQYITMATPELSLNTSPWQHQSCHSIHHHGNTFTFTFTFMHLADAFIQSDLHCIQATVLHLISSCSFDQHQSCHSIHHHGNTRAVTQYITMATPELSLNTSPWQHQSCHSIHQKQSNCYLFEK